jgi:hypothetical protein
MTQDEFYSKLMQDVEYIFKTGFKLSPEIFMQTMSYASEQYELLRKRITELEALQAHLTCDGCLLLNSRTCTYCSRKVSLTDYYQRTQND